MRPPARPTQWRLAVDWRWSVHQSPEGGEGSLTGLAVACRRCVGLALSPWGACTRCTDCTLTAHCAKSFCRGQSANHPLSERRACVCACVCVCVCVCVCFPTSSIPHVLEHSLLYTTDPAPAPACLPSHVDPIPQQPPNPPPTQGGITTPIYPLTHPRTTIPPAPRTTHHPPPTAHTPITDARAHCHCHCHSTTPPPCDTTAIHTHTHTRPQPPSRRMSRTPELLWREALD